MSTTITEVGRPAPRSASIDAPQQVPHKPTVTAGSKKAPKVWSRCDLDQDPAKLSPWRQTDDIEVYNPRHVQGNSGSIVLRRPATRTRPQLAIKKPLRASIRAQNREVWVEHQMLVYLQGDPAVVKPYRVCVRDSASNEFWLETEWVQGVTLEQVLRRGHVYSEDAARPMITNLVLAMLRWQKVINLAHRDLKPANIIVRDDRSQTSEPASVPQDHVVVIDFASASVIDRCRDVQGSDGWRAPELEKIHLERLAAVEQLALENRPVEELSDDLSYDPFKSEVWSVGLLLETMTGAQRPNSGASEQLRDLLENLKESDPDARMALGEVLSHPWFAIRKRPAPLSPSSCRVEELSSSPSSGRPLSARA